MKKLLIAMSAISMLLSCHNTEENIRGKVDEISKKVDDVMNTEQEKSPTTDEQEKDSLSAKSDSIPGEKTEDDHQH